MKKSLGTLYALISAFIFGFTPVLGRLSFDGGSNGITLTFLRAVFAIPVLFVLLRFRGIPAGLSRRELRDLLLIGLAGPAATTLLLYESYHYIPVGIATTLHFLYPVVVSLASFFLFGSKIGRLKALALAASVCGIALFFQPGQGTHFTGYGLALLSSITYTIYMLGVERTSLGKMHYFKLSMYICVVSAALSGLLGLVTRRLTFQLTSSAWVYSFLVAMLVSIGAITLFQMGITLIGASSTAILSMLEPITGVAFGVLVLGETLSLPKLAGCVLILAGVLMVALSGISKNAPPHEGGR